MNGEMDTLRFYHCLVSYHFLLFPLSGYAVKQLVIST